MSARFVPLDLTLEELAARSRLVPWNHVVRLSNGGYYHVRERVELGGVVVGYSGPCLLHPNGGDVDDDELTFELSFIADFWRNWEFVQIFEQSLETTQRCQARERFRADFVHPVGVGRVLEWVRTNDRRAREPEWKARRRAFSQRRTSS